MGKRSYHGYSPQDSGGLETAGSLAFVRFNPSAVMPPIDKCTYRPYYTPSCPDQT
jgi:hypothetical protein